MYINIYIQGATTWPPNPPIFVAAVGGAGGAAATVKKGMILSHFNFNRFFYQLSFLFFLIKFHGHLYAEKLTKSLIPAEPPPPPNPFNTTMKTALSYTAGMGTINALGVGR